MIFFSILGFNKRRLAYALLQRRKAILDVCRDGDARQFRLEAVRTHQHAHFAPGRYGEKHADGV